LAEILATDRALVRAASPSESVTWQDAMRRAIRSSAELLRRLGLPAAAATRALAGSPAPDARAVAEAERDFPTFVPLEFFSRMRPGDPDDPLLRQVQAVAEETRPVLGFTADPVGDRAARVSPGLLQKYSGRVLAIPTGICGVHCRYCFRREFDYADNLDASLEKSLGPEGLSRESLGPESLIREDSAVPTWQPMIEQLRRSPGVDEVILSGGDPLTLSDAKLDRLIRAIEAVPHVRRLRIHSRMPIVIPQRVTEAFVARLQASRLTTWVVVHCNHPQEIDQAVSDSIAMLIDAGIPVLNQAVLLAGVNDDADVLETLCREWVNRRVQPYYLHQLDRITGAAHFEVDLQRGRELIEQLRARLPGYAVPTYVREIAGEASKTPN
jgi:L-lysine 2,3-aminomutase